MHVFLNIFDTEDMSIKSGMEKNKRNVLWTRSLIFECNRRML